MEKTNEWLKVTGLTFELEPPSNLRLGLINANYTDPILIKKWMSSGFCLN